MSETVELVAFAVLIVIALGYRVATRWSPCVLGLHAWRRMGTRLRRCQRCRAEQRLVFYSNRTHEWRTVAKEGK